MAFLRERQRTRVHLTRSDRCSSRRIIDFIKTMNQSSASISVAVVEDDPVLRREFCAMVASSEGMKLIADVGSLAAARAVLAKHGEPDVLIVDLGLPDGDGAELIGELASRAAKTCA